MTISGEFIIFFLGLLLSAWSLYLTSERSRIVDDIKEIKLNNQDVASNLRVAEAKLANDYWTKADHKVFEDRLIHAVEKISDRLDVLIINHENRCANFRTGPKVD